MPGMQNPLSTSSKAHMRNGLREASIQYISGYFRPAVLAVDNVTGQDLVSSVKTICHGAHVGAPAFTCVAYSTRAVSDTVHDLVPCVMSRQVTGAMPQEVSSKSRTVCQLSYLSGLAG